jgi:HemY protein
MKKLLIAFLILLFAVWLGFLIHRDPGYVLITYGSWSIEMSLWVGILLTVIAFALITMIFRLLHHTSRLGSKYQRWDKKRKQKKSAELTTLAICQLLQGDWSQAENNFKKALHGSVTPLVNYLFAARSAHMSQAYDRRDTYLEHGRKKVKAAELSLYLKQAHFQIDAKQWNQAEQTLESIKLMKPNHPRHLKLQKKVLLKMQNWEQLAELLPNLRKYKVLSETSLDALEEKVAVALLSESNDADALKATWDTLPKSTKVNPQVAATFALQSLHKQCSALATSVIETTLKKHWDNKLVKYYGLMRAENESKQIGTAESWLKKHPEDPELLLCLGRLCNREKLWGKAKLHLDKLIASDPSSRAFLALAKVNDGLGEQEAMQDNYRKAAEYAQACPAMRT